MYRLIAKTRGIKFVTCSTQIMDLQRIAVNLGSDWYRITRNGSIVYEQKG